MISLDWQQLLTHTLGFFITLWILKKFLWGPLLSMMEERRQVIIDEFKNIEQKNAGFERLSDEYQMKLKEIDSERRAKLVEAVDEGKKIAEEIRTAAQREAKEFTAKARSELERDVAKAKVQLKNDMIAMTMTAAERIINERLDDAKHRELIGNFIDDVERV